MFANMKLAEKIRRIKGSRSYADIAREVKCSSENIRKIVDQNSWPGFALGVRLAKYLGVPIVWLADDSQDWPPPEDKAAEAVEMVRDALAGAGLAGELTARERAILTHYRALADEMKLKAEGYLIGLDHGGTEDAAKFGAEVNSALNSPGRSKPKE